ncbi:MAG: hypothetical protein GC185_13670 [Alphaproteobacteria bacterium]|nr:hypothetical protein [Alphaproteobacteria bacterium]
MFDWFGKKKREEAWMKQPRRLPDGSLQEPGNEPRWILSREFANGEKKNERMYMAVSPRRNAEGNEEWSMSIYHYDLTNVETFGLSSWPMGTTDDPLEVVRDLRAFERERRAADFVQVVGAAPTYLDFANRFGVHFDDSGNVFRVEQEQPLVKGTYMSRKSLNALFRKKQKPIDSWDELYAQLVHSWPAEWMEEIKPEATPAPANENTQPVKEEPVAEDAKKEEAPAAKENAADAKENAAREQKSGLKEAFNKAASPEPAAAPETPAPEHLAQEAEGQDGQDGEQGRDGQEQPVAEEPVAEPEPAPTHRPVMLEDLAQDPSYPEFAYYARKMMDEVRKIPAVLSGNRKGSVKGMETNHTVKFASASVAKLAQRLSDATLLVGLMRAGADAYADIFSGKQPMSPEMLQLVGDVGTACAELAEKRLGLTAEQSKKVADLLSQGTDPYGPELPLEKIFADFPPAEFKPQPAQPKKKAGYRGSGYTPF